MKDTAFFGALRYSSAGCGSLLVDPEQWCLRHRSETGRLTAYSVCFCVVKWYLDVDTLLHHRVTGFWSRRERKRIYVQWEKSPLDPPTFIPGYHDNLSRRRVHLETTVLLLAWEMGSAPGLRDEGVKAGTHGTP